MIDILMCLTIMVGGGRYPCCSQYPTLILILTWQGPPTSVEAEYDRQLHFPFNYSMGWWSNLGQWDIKRNLFLVFKESTPLPTYQKRDKRREKKEEKKCSASCLCSYVNDIWSCGSHLITMKGQAKKTKKSTCWGWQTRNVKSTWILNDIIMSLH